MIVEVLPCTCAVKMIDLVRELGVVSLARDGHRRRLSRQDGDRGADPLRAAARIDAVARDGEGAGVLIGMRDDGRSGDRSEIPDRAVAKIER